MLFSTHLACAWSIKVRSCLSCFLHQDINSPPHLPTLSLFTMPPTILVVGATGNTGKGVVRTLPSLIKNTSLSSHRILALTRSTSSPAAQSIAALPGIELMEQNWVEITEDWLRRHEVFRVFLASHNEPTQFAEESQFLVNALNAGVKYVVRISTTAANIRPNLRAYYPRSHWAIEQMLDQPEFKAMQWTSLQPNNFTAMFLASIVEFIKQTRRTGQQGPLSVMIDADTKDGLVDAHEVGILAAHLLAKDDTSPHNTARYVVNGPEDVTGRQVVKLAEEHIGAPVRDVRYKDMSFIDQMAANSSHSKNLILSIKHAPDATWNGQAMAGTTSKEVLELYAPRRTVAEILKELIEE